MTTSFEYFLVFEFDTVSQRLRVKGCTREELRDIVKRRKLKRVDDEFAGVIIQFFEMLLIERKFRDKAHLLFLTSEHRRDWIEVYSTDVRQLVAVKLFSSADLL
ncbi:hypothetical protein [Pyrococcus yayanosii]|uniref:Uncharacterized protein n=1 Tax=Pyrococcus yayanosii (strain CH1 / JCM 16557) TaxID=529709 RepID=F8AGI1_PYRYC|nr:hypothetical protein [Pyrococcus yayanosii]AEH25182.1 hypothetical protein PYCH_15140 [Pyrococcus yayanosii CH1]